MYRLGKSGLLVLEFQDQLQRMKLTDSELKELASFLNFGTYTLNGWIAGKKRPYPAMQPIFLKEIKAWKAEKENNEKEQVAVPFPDGNLPPGMR